MKSAVIKIIRWYLTIRRIFSSVQVAPPWHTLTSKVRRTVSRFETCFGAKFAWLHFAAGHQRSLHPATEQRSVRCRSQPDRRPDQDGPESGAFPACCGELYTSSSSTAPLDWNPGPSTPAPPRTMDRTRRLGSAAYLRNAHSETRAHSDIEDAHLDIPHRDLNLFEGWLSDGLSGTLQSQ